MNDRHVFITGSAGFCGNHLVTHLLDEQYDVVGLDCKDASCVGCTGFFSEDVTDAAALRTALRDTGPRVIFHLAASTDPRLEYEHLHAVNALGTLSLLDAAHQVCPEATVLIVSSSAVYGWVSTEDLPIVERQPFYPTNPYAVSKIAQEMVSHQYFVQHGLNIIRTRAFNIVGPGQSTNFVTSAFARQIAEIEAGVREPVIKVGNLESIRDFVDVRDTVRAYRLIAEAGEPGEVYNVCSGEGTSIEVLLNTLLELSTERDIAVQVAPSRYQPADVPIQVGDASRLRQLTDWAPTIPLRRTLKDVLDYWRTQIKEGLG